MRTRAALRSLTAAAAMGLAACAGTPARTAHPGELCIPASERAGREFGCYIIASQSVGSLGDTPVFWRLSRYPSRAAADAARGPTMTVVESFGQVWLLAIGDAGAWPSGGERVAELGPIPVRRGTSYTARFMEAVFTPGMQSIIHRHSGTEVWYTLGGEMCLETPQGSMVGRAGGPPVIVPEGPPMQLTAIGDEVRQGLVLVLHDASQPATTPASDWQPKGLCRR